MQMGKLYSVRITACNRGGESFPTEVLSAYNHPDAKQTVLVVNGFNRLSSPAIIDSIGSQGFNLEADPGVTYGKTIGWSGRQSNFDPLSAGKEGAGALGYGGEELVGKMVAGNDFNYVRTHAEAIQTAGRYNVVSCSGKAVENGLVRLTDYDAVDIDLGLEKDDGHSLYYYKAFRPAMQQQISNYLQHHGNLFVNGAYLASDMKLEAEKQWLANNLKITYAGSNLNNYSAMIKGLGTSFDIYRTINADHYGAYTPDNILPANNTAIAVMAYADGNNAAVAYKGVDYRTFSMAFPLECIKDANTRNKIMRGILAYLLQ